jgi:hypothetical protein
MINIAYSPDEINDKQRIIYKKKYIKISGIRYIKNIYSK